MKSPSGKLVEPLTRRERAILLHLAEDKSNREIAALEVLSLNSVKWYIQQIYGKLGVNRRREAIERARSLGLLPTPEPIVPPETTAAEVRSSSLPSGTVTFLFTDIEGSTPMWEQRPQEMAAALQIHNAALRRAIEANGGVVFKTVGDAFQAAFPTALQGLKAAIQGQRALQAAAWNELGPLKVRMGLHTGEAELDQRGDEYAVSHAKNRIGRIHSIAYGGQILLSQETADLVLRQLPEGVTLKDLGDHHLKGLQWSEHLYQVCAPGLMLEFPPLATLITNPNNLPIQMTSFIGREKEIAEVCRLLKDHRLVTLTGAGGTGKTRLALQTAAGLLEQFADGTWLVELAPLSDPALVPAITARSLGLRELPGAQMIILLQEYLEKRQVLLILDNCEHVIEACVRLADALLQSCPKLSILVSSREVLGIAGEVPLRVPPLTLPDMNQMLPIEELAQYEAIRLFVERATTVSPGFTLTEANAPAILQVCQRLDGIPLAIELAAARVKLLQVAEIAQRLDDRFHLLTGGSRAALPRHQTLRASIDWSYELLSAPEGTLLQRLSVFAGGWTLEGAEAIGCGEGIQACDVLELLGHLVDKSLVQTVSAIAGLNRFRMLETIRQYTHEKLVESGQEEAGCQRHLQYYLELAEKVEWKIRGPDQAEILERMEAELDNLRLALAWLLEGRGRPGWNPEPGLRLAAALQWFWHCRGRQDEGIQWLELLLTGEAEERGSKPITPERTRCRAKALYVAAYSANQIYEISKACRFSEESRELYQSLGPEDRVGYAYARLSCIDPRLDFKGQCRWVEECLAIFRAAGDRFGIGQCLTFLGNVAMICKEYERMQGYYEESLALQNEIGDRDGIADSFHSLGILAFTQGKIEQARALVEESQRIFSEIRNEAYRGILHLNLGDFDMMEGNYAQAAAHYREALYIGRRQGDVGLISSGLIKLGELALLQEQPLEATERFEESLAYVRKKDHKIYIAVSLYTMGLSAWAAGELGEAEQRFTNAQIKCQEGGDTYLEAKILCGMGKVAFARGKINITQELFKQAFKLMNYYHYYHYFGMDQREPAILTLEFSAYIAAAQGQMMVAACLLGSTEVWHKRFSYTRLPRERQERDACIAAVRAALGEQAFTAAFAEGQAMTEEQAVAYVLEQVS
jgi:predicted ATPase/class 3 adenylate cyclase/Flp pilus assembly protein TadD